MHTCLARGSYLVPVDDTRLHVTVGGREDGPVLLYLHGGAGHYSGDFQHFAGPSIADLGQVIYLDQRGCGSSPACKGAYSMNRLVADLAELHHRLGAPRWHLVGHSFGGILATEYARRHPDHVASLFLISTPVEMTEATLARMQRAAAVLASRDPDAAKELQGLLTDRSLTMVKRYVQALPLMGKASEVIFARPEAEESFHKVLRAHHFSTNVAAASSLLEQGLLEYSLAPALLEARHPLTAVYGREDQSLYDQQARRLAAIRPDSRVLALSETGHFVYVEHPERMALALRDHLAGVS